MILHADAIDFGALRAEFGLPGEFPEDVLRQAETASDREAGSRVDLTAIPFVSIDPPGARDLDQAVHIEATDRGHRVRYAIADVGAVIEPGSALETESLRRGQTLYLPDGSVPLHPRSLSEGSGSLLPGETRPAVVWSVEVDPEGETVAVEVGRALVRNTARLDYAGVQADADTGRLHPSIAALPLVGDRLRLRGSGRAPSRSGCRRRRWSGRSGAGRWPSSRASRPTSGTRRCPCSWGAPRRSSWSPAGTVWCGPCPGPPTGWSPGCDARPRRSAWRGRRRRGWAPCSTVSTPTPRRGWR